MNPLLDKLHPYPFEKLTHLLQDCKPPLEVSPLNLAIGEPKHPVPPFILRTMADDLRTIGHYPVTRGGAALRQAAAGWLERRFGLPAGVVSPDRHVLPVNGTREALFSIAQGVIDPGRKSVVLMPNPFYQIYEGAALMAGARPVYLDATAENGFLPRFDHLSPELLDQTALLYLCTPGNPTGAVLPLERMVALLALAERHDFIIACDECYSEIWYQQPPAGILEAAWHAGRTGFQRCLAFHSLSKRSNMPGARSGFVAGDATVLAGYFRMRTYTGCTTPPFVQQAAIAAWQDEAHVEENRRLYREKLAAALAILEPVMPVVRPQAGFYLWLRVPGGGELFAKRLFQQYHVTVLPGAYLGRPGKSGTNPGSPYIRVAMVAPAAENSAAMRRIARCAREILQENER